MKLRYRLILIVVGLFLFIQVVNADITYNPSTNTIIITGTNSGNPWTFEDIYQADQTNGWGKVSKQENQYRFDCKLQIGDGSTETEFYDTNKQVIFTITSNTQIIYIKENAKFQLGNNNFFNGCSLFFSGTTSSYNGENIICDGELYLYNCKIQAEEVGRYVLITSFGKGEIKYCLFDTLRGLETRTSNATIENIQIINSNFAIASPAFINNLLINKATYAILYRGYQFSEITMKNVNAKNHTYLCIFFCSDEANLYLIDCNYENENIDWRTSYGDNGNCFIQYTFDPVIVDKNCNPIPYANVKLYDKNNNLVFEDSTDENGKLTNSPHYITIKKISHTASGETITTYNPFTIKITKDGYATYESKITIDHKIENDFIVLDSLTYTHDKDDKEIQEFKNNYIYILAISIFIFLISKFTRTSFIALVAGIWLLILAVYTFQYGTPAFKDYSTIFAAIPLVLGVYMVIDGALGIIYD